MNNIYQHFRPEEKEFIDQVLTWKQYVEDRYAPRLTDFLDPRQLHIVKSVIGTGQSVKVDIFGGYSHSERKRALLFPEYLYPSNEDFQVSLFEIKYPNKYTSITHRQVLGTLMSLGIKREKFGDILLNQDRIQFIIAREMSEFLKLELHQIGKTPILLKEVPVESVIPSGEAWSEMQTTVSSLRLDAILSSVFNMSRQKAQTLIQHGLVKVNWRVVEQVSFLCEEEDVISARGCGRCKIILIDGQTKKEKWRIKAGVLK
ncbi:RNA-binding protein [Heyndrickxia sporothermodurans]